MDNRTPALKNITARISKIHHLLSESAELCERSIALKNCGNVTRRTQELTLAWHAVEEAVSAVTSLTDALQAMPKRGAMRL